MSESPTESVQHAWTQLISVLRLTTASKAIHTKRAATLRIVVRDEHFFQEHWADLVAA